jgi:hypothetical protein
VAEEEGEMNKEEMQISILMGVLTNLYKQRAEYRKEQIKSVTIIMDFEKSETFHHVIMVKKQDEKPQETTDIKILPDGRVGAKDAAKYLGLSSKTLAMYRSSGEGPKFIKKGRIFYFIDDLNEWLEKGRKK